MVAKNLSTPLLTVLMPVYNADKFLAESINSILSQTYSDFEMLILDDASTDNSLKIIKAYAKEDKRIKILVNKNNQKQAKCRNRLLKNSKTEFIAWMDADDISLEDRLQTQMDFLKQNPKIDAVGVQYSAFGSSGNRPANFTSHFSLSDIEIKTNFIFGYDFLFGGSLMRMKKIKQHNIFFNNNYKLLYRRRSPIHYRLLFFYEICQYRQSIISISDREKWEMKLAGILPLLPKALY